MEVSFPIAVNPEQIDSEQQAVHTEHSYPFQCFALWAPFLYSRNTNLTLL